MKKTTNSMNPTLNRLLKIIPFIIFLPFLIVAFVIFVWLLVMEVIVASPVYYIATGKKYMDYWWEKNESLCFMDNLYEKIADRLDEYFKD